MVEILRWLAFISFIGGVVGGLIISKQLGGEIEWIVVIPYAVGGFVSGVVFAVLAEVLYKVREMHANMNVKKPASHD